MQRPIDKLTVEQAQLMLDMLEEDVNQKLGANSRSLGEIIKWLDGEEGALSTIYEDEAISDLEQILEYLAKGTPHDRRYREKIAEVI